MSTSLSQQKTLIRSAIQTNNFANAKSLLESFNVPDNTDVEYWQLVSTIHLNLQDINSAISAYKKIITLTPKNANALSDIGYLYQLLKQNNEASYYFNQALELDKNNLNATYNSARLHMSIGDLSTAETLFRKAIKIRPEFTESYISLGNIYKELRRVDDALESFKKALRYDKNSFLAHANLAILLEQTNQLDDAKKHSQLALALNPKSHAITLSLATINRRQGNTDECIQLLKQSILLASTPIERASSHNALGKTLEQQQLYCDAFKSFSDANQACKNICTNSISGYSNHINENAKIIESMTAPQANDTQIKAPIFLVGFPRSGTTLTEQILSSHHNLVVSEEHPIISQIASNMTSLIGKPAEYPNCISSLTDDELEILRQTYWDLAKKFAGADIISKRFIDKSPLNLVELNFINRLFPNAHIIVLIRDPRDVCLSCFSHSFSPDQVIAAHFLELDTTASLYNTVMNLWFQYRSKLPINYLEVRYEDLIDNMQVVTRQILDFLGEEWDDSVMSYFSKENTRFIKTPSYEGVSQPIYSTSIDKWKKYEHEIESILPTLSTFIRELERNRGQSTV